MNQNATPSDQHRPWGLLILTGLLLLTLAFVAATFFLLARNARYEQSWVQWVTQAQVSSQQLSKSAGEAAGGKPEALAELATSKDRLELAVRSLQSGSVSDQLPPVPKKAAEAVAQLAATWSKLDANAARIHERESLLLALADASNSLLAIMPEIQDSAEQAAAQLIEQRAPSRQISAASRLPILAERMLRRVPNILMGGSMAVNEASDLQDELAAFSDALNALQSGNDEGVRPVTDAQALAALGQVAGGFEQARPLLETTLDSSATLFEVRGAADEIFLDSRQVFEKAGGLSAAIEELSDTRVWPSVVSGIAGLAAMFIIAALLLRSVILAERQRATVATSRDRQNQRAIKQLLSELGSLAEGDLTVRTTVTEEITRDIAAAVNYAVKRLREIVAGINETSEAVSHSAQTTRASASKLAEAAAQQAEQMGSATEDIRQMATAFDSMAKQSQASSEVAHKSVEIASNGAAKVRETIAGMDLIRDQIQETSKRIKRLGESTQEIGDIIGLINGIAEQTNVLALNAAIQAASAGGAGKGIAMVADEVQELAENASHATRRIESIVQTIQADTSEAVHSMESTTSEVVRGAHLAEDAGAALQKIEAVSNDLASMIHAISSEAQSQSDTATGISELMNKVRDVSMENSQGSKQTAETIDELAELVLRLSSSVSDFKLPAKRAARDS